MSTERIGVVAFWKNYDRKIYLKAARLADELGYDSFWLPETWGYNAFPLMTEMARETRRIRLGTGILNVFSRTPALLAMSAATMQEISGGRFLLGIGTSGIHVVEGFHGRAYDKPLTQVLDTIRIVRGLLEGRSLHECGAKLGSYRPFKLAAGLGQPRVPIYVASLNERAVRKTGALADGWLPSFWPYEDLQRGRSWLMEGAVEAGRDPSELDVGLFTVAIPARLQRAEDMARDAVAFYVGGMGTYYRDLLSASGFGDECEEIARLYGDKTTRRRAGKAVSEAMLESLAVLGDPLSCRRELQRRRSFGMDLPIVTLPPGMPWPAVRLYLEALAPRRIPSAFQITSSAAMRLAQRLS